MKSVTVIAPVYNEEESIGAFFSMFSSILRASGYMPKFLVVNDCSTDKTLAKILAIKKTSQDQIKVICLTENVGQHICLLAALDHVSDTDYGVITDADMQNPPELIIPMLQLLKKNNYNIVYGRRAGNRLGNGLLSQLFWITMSLCSLGKIPGDQSPLKVFDKIFIRNFQHTDYRYSTFNQAALAQVKGAKGFYPVTTTPRIAGHSKYTFLSRLKLYLSAIRVVIVGGSQNKNYTVTRIYD